MKEVHVVQMRVGGRRRVRERWSRPGQTALIAAWSIQGDGQATFPSFPPWSFPVSPSSFCSTLTQPSSPALGKHIGARTSRAAFFGNKIALGNRLADNLSSGRLRSEGLPARATLGTLGLCWGTCTARAKGLQEILWTNKNKITVCVPKEMRT